MIKCTKEDLHLLSEEMQSVLSYCKEHKQLNAAMNTEEQYTCTKELTALLLQMLEDMKLYECKAKAVFAKADAMSSTEATYVISLLSLFLKIHVHVDL